MTEKDLSQYKKYQFNGLTFYVEITEDGRKILRHIRIFSNRYSFEMPEDGTTIDVVPPNSVGSEQIVDKGVHEEDLDDNVNEKLNALENADEIPEEELEECWEQAMRDALDGAQGAGFDAGADDGSLDI